MRVVLRAVCAALLVGGFAVDGDAQSRATAADLVGEVRDQSQAVLPGVTVTATSLATNQSRSVVTDLRGRYVIPALAPGEYRIAAELAGFATETRENVRLALGTS